jgi:hypothetical protein
MDVYLPKSFQREAKKNGISDEDCQEAIRRAERGDIDADLGGGLIKQRIPRGNRSAAKGSRAVAFHKRAEVAVLLHVYPKSRKASLRKSELTEYRVLAQSLKGLSKAKLKELGITKGWKKLET